jgi:hypothetical protein
MGDLSDFTPLYLNELLYMDWVIASIVDELKDSGLLDNTLVVITNDHGEMVGGKDGHVGHGWAVTPQLANTPLIIMDPARHGFQTNTTIGNQVDLLPTILDRLNISIPADQLYEGLSLDAGAAREGRLSYLNSYKEFGIVSGNEVLLGDREADSPTGAASNGAVYKISNEGTATVFTLQTDEPKKEELGAPGAATQPEGSVEQAGPGSDSTSAGLGSHEARRTAMSQFDAFQASLLRNYDFYSRLLRARTIAQAGPMKKP